MMPLDDLTRQKLQQLREEFANKAADAERQKQAAWNAEQMANKPPTNKAKGGIIKSASSRADGIIRRGKTRGTIVKHGK
jgi:FKBP-type peptidyl-prolyl cis-trans isomerase